MTRATNKADLRTIRCNMRKQMISKSKHKCSLMKITKSIDIHTTIVERLRMLQHHFTKILAISSARTCHPLLQLWLRFLLL